MDPKRINDIRWRSAWLRARLDGLSGLTAAHPGAGSDWIERRTRHVQALDTLSDELAAMPDKPTIKADGAGARVRMLGISSTSTMGVGGALRNWLVRAQQLQAE